MECIKNGYFENREAVFASMNSSYTQYQEGDIVFAKVTPCFENGNIAIMQGLSFEFGFGSSELFVLRPKSINTKFLFYYLQSQLFKDATGKGYEEWLSDKELHDMNMFFQRRHLIEHNNGMVDQKYVDKSGDNSYVIGQRLVVKESDAYALLAIIKNIICNTL